MSEEREQKIARTLKKCWLCQDPIEVTNDQPVRLANRINEFCMHYNCRWSDSGVRWVDGMKTLKDVDTAEYVTPHLHPPWLVKMNHERKLGLRPPHSQDIAWAAGKQPPKS